MRTIEQIRDYLEKLENSLEKSKEENKLKAIRTLLLVHDNLLIQTIKQEANYQSKNSPLDYTLILKWMEEENIFEGAKFGDKFWTANEQEFPKGRMAIFTRFCEDIITHEVVAILYLDNSFSEIWCTLDGRYFEWVGNEKKFYDDTPSPYIVGKYQEPIDEEKLNNLSKEYTDYSISGNCADYVFDFVKATFKAGYKKAKEE